MQGHAEANSFVEHGLRVIGRVNVVQLSRLHEAVLAVNESCDDTVSDGLRDYLLGLFNAVERKLVLDVNQGDLRVGNVQFLQTELEHGVSESVNKRVRLVSLEHDAVLVHDLVEGNHVATFHTVHDLEVGLQRSLQELLSEDLPVWDLAHEQFHNYLQLYALNPEAFCTHFGGFSQGLDKHGVTLRVLKLNSLDAAQVVKIPGGLVVGDVLRERCFHNELPSLLVEVLGQVGA